MRQSAFAEFFPSVFRVPRERETVAYFLDRGLALVPKTRKKSCPTKRRPAGMLVTAKSIIWHNGPCNSLRKIEQLMTGLLWLEVLLLPGRKEKSGWISLELNCKLEQLPQLGIIVLLQPVVLKVLPPGKGPGLPRSFSL